MKKISVIECKNKLQRLGRTYDAADGDIYINWTCSGIRFKFTGSSLVAELGGICGEETDINLFDGTSSKRKTWPYAAVFIDDSDEPSEYFEVNSKSHKFLLFSSEKEETHIITLRKLTENPKGKIAVKNFICDGTIDKPDKSTKKLNIEFIGDSITCGFGNKATDRDRPFFAEDENGWLSHAAIAARKLDADFSIVSYSGIAITKGIGKYQWPASSMADLYPYTDRLIEEQLNKQSGFLEWDFKRSKYDVIVLNLGTNDATVIDFNEDIIKGTELFERDYYNFLSFIREKNGKTPYIICSLGSMDYYLYDNIKKVVKEFALRNHDDKISCFKYSRIRVTDGYGACGHPNLITQERMGVEISDYIRSLLHK